MIHRPDLTMTDVMAALELADDHGIDCVRAPLPGGIGSAEHDGTLYVDPRLPLSEYGRQLVDGIHAVVAAARPGRQLRVVPPLTAQPRTAARAVGE